jgi:acetylornithine/succinyldiaminopimelate/putrescine aminotransferase
MKSADVYDAYVDRSWRYLAVYSFGHRNPEVLETLLGALESLDAGVWTLPTREALDFQDAVRASAPAPALCRQRGALLIDETRTALGRSGRTFMTSHCQVEPDMLILGKGLGAGLYPVSALVTTQALYDDCMNSTRWGFMGEALADFALHQRCGVAVGA